MKKGERRRPLTDQLSLPAEIMPGAARTTLSGGSEVYVENHAGLKSYSRNCIEVKTRGGILRICGDELELAAMTKTDIVIQGFVISVERI